MLKGKHFVVVGGTGSIGSEIVSRLIAEGCQLLTVCRGIRYDIIGKRSDLWPYNPAVVYQDVTEQFDQETDQLIPFMSGLIYTVGFCPPGGFQEEVSVPLSNQAVCERLKRELLIHVYGLGQLCATVIPMMKTDGHIVVIGSAITRLTDEQCPPWLHAGHYAAAKAAQHELCRWLRRDPLVKEKNILVHYLAPGAVDTPFHQGAPEHMQPPAMLPISAVVDEVIAALESTEVVDKELIARPSQ